MALTTGCSRPRQVARSTVARPALESGRRLILPFRVAAVLAGQLFDFATFTIMFHRHGIAAELNPLVASGFASFGMPILVLMKLALFVLLASIVTILGRHRPQGGSNLTAAGVIAVLACVAGLVGGISNVLAT
jgi:Domain of unknown function (DUF5658)